MGICAASDETVSSADMVDQMLDVNSTYDVVIVCTSSQQMEDYWQDRLDRGRGKVCGKETTVLVVHEDWEGGAGNGLGSLYAFQKAQAKATESGCGDLVLKMQEGKISMVIYHTAGKGTRLAPLPGAEGNNKPGVKLPSPFELPLAPSADAASGEDAEPATENVLLTILEAVIIQTSIYANSHKGRLAVYWGDQVFVPTVDPRYQATHHADILAQLGPMPSAEDWEKKQLHKYGLIAVEPETGDATQLEKVQYETAAKILPETTISKGQIGTSLGSFSISSALLAGLLGVFDAELKAKQGKFDTDPHWWMPMCLPLDDYKSVMGSKGMDEAAATEHFNRIGEFTTKFLEEQKDGPLKTTKVLGAVPIGQECYWWDYGQLKLYRQNVLLAKEDNIEAGIYRKFLKIAGLANGIGCNSVVNETATKDSVVVLSQIGKGSVESSVLSKCNIGEVNVKNSVLVNVTAAKVEGEGLVLYNVCDESEGGLILEKDAVRGDCYLPGGEKLRLVSDTATDGGKVWKEKSQGLQKDKSFEDVYNANQGADVIEINKQSEADHQRASEALRLNQAPAPSP